MQLYAMGHQAPIIRLQIITLEADVIPTRRVERLARDRSGRRLMVLPEFQFGIGKAKPPAIEADIGDPGNAVEFRIRAESALTRAFLAGQQGVKGQ